MNILTLDARLWQAATDSGISRQEVHDIVSKSAVEAAKLLPSKFKYLNIVINPVDSEWVIPETGAMGITYSDEYISVTFDPNLPYGTEQLKTALHGMVFHEMTHATTFAHDPWRSSAMFGAVTEGLATVFEREYGDQKPIWGEYEDDDVMQVWYSELRSLEDAGQKDLQYFVNHPDGRKWIVYKTGTWMIDKLIKRDYDLFELMKLSHKDIIEQLEAVA